MENYKKLQDLVKKYEKTKIWKYVDGDDIFKLAGFEKEIYVSIMGRANIDCSIAIYYGKQDLLSQLDITYGQYKNSPDSFIRLNAYKIEIGDPGNMLLDEDKKLLKKNGLKPNNVVFRLENGKFPRMVTEEECLLLIDILERIIEISEYIISNKFNLELETLEYMFSFSKIGNKITSKKVKWPILEYEFIKQKKLKSDLMNKGTLIRKRGIFNIGLFYGPMFIEETMSYPLLVIIHDAEKNIIVDIIIIKDAEKDMIANKILNSLITKNLVPEKITFNSNEIPEICKEIITSFNILFRVNENMEELFNIWVDIYNNLS